MVCFTFLAYILVSPLLAAVWLLSPGGPCRTFPTESHWTAESSALHRRLEGGQAAPPTSLEAQRSLVGRAPTIMKVG